MNISSVSTNNFYKFDCNKNQKFVLLNRQNNTDCFVKSNNISFCAGTEKEQRRQRVDAFTKDLAKKVNSPNFSISDVSASIRKHIKNVNVKPMSQAPKSLLFSNTLQGLYSAEMNYNGASNRFFYPQNKRNFYVRTETFKKQYGKLEVFTNAVHEYTHALQIEDEDANPVGIFNRYIEQNKDDIGSAMKQIEITTSAINQVEEAIARPLISILIENENLSYDRLQRGQTDFVSWLCRKNKTEDFSSYVQEKVSAVIGNIEQDFSVDKILLYDTTINHFEREIESYSSENNAHQMVLGIGNTRAMSRVQIYQKSIDVLKQMKKEIV